MSQAKKPLVSLSLNGGHTPPPLSSASANSRFQDNSIAPVPVENVDVFEHNPRRFRNQDKYLELKESIRLNGVIFPIQVTKRPGADKFVVARGGNSRLTAMKELFLETQDVRFKYIPAQEIAYVSEQDILKNHYIENEMRSDMCFWDKAHCYYQICLNNGMSENTPLRTIEDTLREKEQLNISHVLIGLFMFSITKLKDLGELVQHLSKGKVIELRKYYHSNQSLLEAIEVKSNEYDEFWVYQLDLFAAKQVDSGDLNIKLLMQDIDSALKQRWVLPETQKTAARSSASTKNAPGDSSLNRFEAPGASQSNSNAPVGFEVDDRQTVFDGGGFSVGVPEQSTVDLNANNDAHGQSATQRIEDRETNTETAPKQFIENGAITVLDAVAELALFANIADMVMIHPEMKFGFWVEMPDLELEGHDPDIHGPAIVTRSAHAQDVWWFLVNLTEQSDRESDAYYQIPRDSGFHQVFSNDDHMMYAMNTLIGSYYSKVEHWFRTEDEPFIALLNNLFFALRRG